MRALVKLVGIGPGIASLVTVQAVEAIREADAIRHPEGCEPALLGLARPGADIQVMRAKEELLELAAAGRRVAVLFPGDPYAFSNGAHVADMLSRSGIEFEVVPGLLLETSAPALSGIPLTLTGKAASVRLGEPDAERPETQVVRLQPGFWDAGVKALLDAGEKPDSPGAIIVNPGQSGQERISAPLAELAPIAAERGLEGDALLVVGPGVELSGRLDTLARRPLHGRSVLITRARRQAEPFRRQLADLGARTVEIPTIEIKPLPAAEEAAAAIAKLPETRLVIFTSANAVSIFFDLLFEAGGDARRLHRSKICAIGPETARQLEERGVRPELIAGEYTAEGLAEALQGWDLTGARVLVPRAKVARDALPALLAQRGAEVEILPVYETICPHGTADALRRLFAAGGVDAAAFTSSSTVYNFVKAFPESGLGEALGDTKVACIGPVTADTARKLGMRVDIIAREYTTRGLALAIAEALS
jgi:uroporphyrinogen III methyltransferase/synthase